jgi:transcriptional regulator with XRE-family HTH domain
MASSDISVDLDAAWYRRSVGVALMRLRERNKLTQEQAARRLHWSLSKISRGENAAHALSVTDVEALLRLYAADGVDEAGILESARRALEPSWWHPFRDIASPEFRRLLSYERSAEGLRAFHPSLIPGLLQTEEYARALITMWIEEPDMLKRHVELRMRRKELLRRQPAPNATFVIAEAALYNRIGGPETMRDQLGSLREMALGAQLRLGVVPFTDPAFPAMLLGFDVIDLPHGEVALFLETPHEARTARDEEHLNSRYAGYFAELCERARFGSAAAALLGRALERLGADGDS